MYFDGYAADEGRRVHSQHERYSLTMRVHSFAPVGYCPLLDGVASPQIGGLCTGSLQQSQDALERDPHPVEAVVELIV
jgi:hypothetical protein